MILVLEIVESLHGGNELARDTGDGQFSAGQAMRLTIDRHPVELHAGRTLYIGYGAARSHGEIQFIGENHLEIIGSEMLANNGHLSSGRSEAGGILFRGKPMMVIRRIPVIHLPDQFIESGFVVLVQPERNANLLGQIFSTKHLGG